jgi:charged multivesicular body protein 6
MGNLISKKPVISSKDKSILELKVQRDKLKQYEKKLQQVLDKELQVAKEQLRLKNHHAARLALSKKKYQEQLLLKTGEQLLTLEQLTQAIEYALVEQDLLKGLQEGNKVLAQIHKEMDLNAVEKIMDDTADGIAYQNEIQEMISQQFTETDEAEIMAQLDELVEMEVTECLTKAKEKAQALDLPSVPVTDVDVKGTWI